MNVKHVSHVGLAKVPLKKRRFAKINRRVRERTANTDNFFQKHLFQKYFEKL